MGATQAAQEEERRARQGQERALRCVHAVRVRCVHAVHVMHWTCYQVCPTWHDGARDDAGGIML